MSSPEKSIFRRGVEVAVVTLGILFAVDLILSSVVPNFSMGIAQSVEGLIAV